MEIIFKLDGSEMRGMSSLGIPIEHFIGKQKNCNLDNLIKLIPKGRTLNIIEKGGQHNMVKDKLSKEFSDILDKATKNDLTNEEIMEIEKVALINLKKEVETLFEDMSKEEVVETILDKLGIKALGQLLEE